MTHRNLIIASLGSFTLASVANAAITVTTNASTWATEMANLPATYVDPGAISNVTGSGNNWTGGDGWEYFALTSTATSGAVSTTGSSPAVTALNFASSTTFAFTQFQFDFVGAEAAWGPTGTNGIYGVLFNITFTPNTSGITVTVNGTQNFTVSTPNTGVIGVYSDLLADGRIDTISFSLSSGQSAVMTGYTVGIIPAPGALALLGAAGLVTGRRRR